MNITKNLTTINRSVYSNRPIDYIVIHYFGALGSARDTCAYFKSVNRSASAHYFVDNDGIWQCVEDKNAAWHCGDGGRGTLKGRCMNRNSIGIEVRPYKLNAATASASDADWYFDAATVANLTELVRAKMAEYGIDADHVIRHYDVTAKWCPRPWLGDDINQYYGKPGNQLWAEWKKSLTAATVASTEEDEDMVRYAKLADIPNNYGFQNIINTLMTAEIIKGDGSDKTGNNDVIDLSQDQVRSLIFEYRGGAFDRALIAHGMSPVINV